MPQEERGLRRRLSMDIPTEIYKEMKKATINRNCTLTKWMLRIIVEELKKEHNRSDQSAF